MLRRTLVEGWIHVLKTVTTIFLCFTQFCSRERATWKSLMLSWLWLEWHKKVVIEFLIWKNLQYSSSYDTLHSRTLSTLIILFFSISFKAFDVPPQEVLTKDSVTVSVDAVVYYRVSEMEIFNGKHARVLEQIAVKRVQVVNYCTTCARIFVTCMWRVNFATFSQISDPLKAVVQVANYSHSTRLLAATTLRNVLGTRNLSELLIEREAISHTMVRSSIDCA